MGKKLAFILVVCCTTLCSQLLWALSLSNVELKSGLNQVLDARVMLLAVNKEELGSLVIRIEDHPNLVHELKENENGYYISISSRDVIKEPVLNFSLDVSWNQGRLIRNFSLLIDPRK
jgi:pilus assembly protein FimV